MRNGGIHYRIARALQYIFKLRKVNEWPNKSYNKGDM
jgi:hypothetical protein